MIALAVLTRRMWRILQLFSVWIFISQLLILETAFLSPKNGVI